SPHCSTALLPRSSASPFHSFPYRTGCKNSLLWNGPCFQRKRKAGTFAGREETGHASDHHTPERRVTNLPARREAGGALGARTGRLLAEDAGRPRSAGRSRGPDGGHL